MLLLGGLFFAIPPFFYPLIHSPGPLLALRFLHGLATAIFSPVAAAAVADLASRRRGEQLGWFAAASDLGATLGPLIGGLILYYTVSYSSTYLAVGVLGLLPLPLLLGLPPSSREPAGKSSLGERLRGFGEGIKEVLTSRGVIIASSLEALLYVGYGAFLGFFPTYARGIGLNDAQIALVMGGQLATTMLAKPISGRLSDTWGRKPMIVAGLCLCAGTLPLIPALTSIWVLFIISACFGLGVAIVTPSTTALVADLVRAGRMGSAMGVFGTIWDSGEAAGPILAGFLIASLSYSYAFSLIGALMLGMALVFSLAVKDPGASRI
jgi:MFS family permease